MKNDYLTTAYDHNDQYARKPSLVARRTAETVFNPPISYILQLPSTFLVIHTRNIESLQKKYSVNDNLCLS